jgi:hypothetical protein
MNFKNLLFSALGLAVAATALPASAQEQGPLEEIVVTSAKREQTLQDSGNTNFFIRGFGNGANNAGIEPSVGVFIDGVYLSFALGLGTQ